MLFTVPDLKNLSSAVQGLTNKKISEMSTVLHRRQPELCEIIDWVAVDPRCTEAHWFCTMFCALLFRHAEGVIGQRLPCYPGDAIQETAGLIARGDKAIIGNRACEYPKRIFRHVLVNSDFDDDDSEWLCTTISAFLFIMERSNRPQRRG